MTDGLARAWRILLTDKQVLSTAMAAPIALALISPLPYLGEVARDIPIAVVDLDRSDTSRAFTRRLTAHEAVRPMSFASLPEAQASFYGRRSQGIVLIPYGFERSLQRGENSLLATYSDASYLLVNRQVANGVTDVASAASTQLSDYRLQGAGLSSSQAQAVLTPIHTSISALFNAAGNYAVYQVPALIVLIVQMTLLSAIGTAIGAANENGVDLGLRAPERLLGFALGFASLSGALLLLLQIALPHWYGYQSRAPLLALLAAGLPFVLSTAGIGIALGAWFRIREAASLAYVFLSLPLFMLAGYAWPAEAQPSWIRALASLSPSTTAIDTFIRLDQMGAPLLEMRMELLQLWGLATASLAGAMCVHIWTANHCAK